MTKTMKWKDIIANAVKNKKSVEKQRKLVGVSGFNSGELLAIFASAIKNPGKDITISKSYHGCPDCTGNGVSNNLKKSEYLDVANRALKWLNDKEHGYAAPNYISYGKSGKISVRLAIFAFCKILVFYDEHNQLPNTCWFSNNVFYEVKSIKGSVCKKISSRTGIKVVDYKTMYSAMSRFRYLFYYEDHQTQSETIEDMEGNCVDLNQVEYAGLVEIYGKDKVQIVRGVVSCSDGVYGHVWCRIKLSSGWTNIDASAAARGKPIGSVICQSVVSVTAINPSWAVNDTGGN